MWSILTWVRFTVPHNKTWSFWEIISSKGEQGSVQESFSLLLNDGIESILIKVADESKVGVVTSILKGRIKIQNNLVKLDKWSEINKTKLKKKKMQLYLDNNK